MEKPSTARVALKWGLISALITIVYSVIMILIDKYQDPAMNTINFLFGIVVGVGVLVLAMREFRTLNDGYLSYGQGLGVGTLTSAVSGVISGLFTFIYMRFVDPNVMDKALECPRRVGASGHGRCGNGAGRKNHQHDDDAWCYFSVERVDWITFWLYPVFDYCGGHAARPASV
ncbi:MAG: DUF4199 domain-containing protein [Cytophagaceae bacterium]|nr:DUF4199 domain-containing protein [Cytophagaceae bacterium]